MTSVYQAERLPPHDVAAEEAVLGSLLLDEEAVFKVAAHLTADDYYRDRNRWVYEACLNLYDRRENINHVTLAHELNANDRLEAVGGHAYLSYLVAAVPTSVFVDHYAQIVRRTAMLRRLINAAGQIAALGYEGGPDSDAVLSEAERIILSLGGGRSVQDFMLIRDVIDEYLEDPKDEGRDARLPRILTEFTRLDRVLGGLHRSDLVILAARPGLGKTSLALSVAFNAAIKQGAHIAIFSLEMTNEQLLERMLSGEARVDMQRLRLGHLDPKYLTDDEQSRIIDATSVLSDTQIYLDDAPMLTAYEIRSKARRLHYEVGLDLIVVDYIQLIRGTGFENGRGQQENRVQQMGEISRTLKGVARELNVPVLALSQLSRAVESRQPHIPQLADLRESGAIEQDADVVMFIYREDAYYSKEEWDIKYPTKKYPEGIAEIMIAKHRNGPTGEVDLYFEKKTARFHSLAAPGIVPEDEEP